MRRTLSPLLRPAVSSPLAAALLATVIALLTLDFFGMRWDVPLSYNGDGLAVASHFKTVIDTGWYEYQANLGAPYGQRYNDFPTSDNLHFIAALVLGLVWPHWGVVMNVHFLLGFPLAAMTAAWFFRRLGIPPLITIALAVLFAIAPYHFLRGEGHLFLSWYWMVPPAISLVLAMLRGESVWGARQAARRGFGHLTGRSGRTVLTLALLATASAYYAVFTLILGGVAALAALWLTHNWRRFTGALAAAGVTAAVLLINMAPDLLYRLAHGANADALQRSPVESEIYGIKLAQLLLPAPYHRLEPFRRLRQLYDEHYPLPSENPVLGIVAALGLVALVVAAFYLIAWAATRLGGEGRLRDAPPATALQLAPLGFIALLAFLFSTVGGLSTLVSFATTAVRSWNRISIVIALVALAAVGLLVTSLLRRTAGGSRGLAVAAAVLPAVILLGVGVADQTPPISRADRQVTIESFDSDAAFAKDVAAAVGDDGSIFELPYIPFPESPPVGTALDTDQLRLWLHSDLPVSGGGIRGRDDVDSLADVAALPPAEFVTEAERLGFDGAVLDSNAEAGEEWVLAIQAVRGGETITSRDGRFVFVSF